MYDTSSKKYVFKMKNLVSESERICILKTYKKVSVFVVVEPLRVMYPSSPKTLVVHIFFVFSFFSYGSGGLTPPPLLVVRPLKTLLCVFPLIKSELVNLVMLLKRI